MANDTIRRAKSDRYSSMQIDTDVPFQSVKAVVSKFGEVAVNKRPPNKTRAHVNLNEIQESEPKSSTGLFSEVALKRRSRRSYSSVDQNMIDDETKLQVTEKELNDVKQILETTQETKAKAESELEAAKQTLQDMASKLAASMKSKQASIEASEAAKQKTKPPDDMESEQLYTDELDATKQELDKTRRDYDAVLETKTAALRKTSEAQSSAEGYSQRVVELSKEIADLKEAIEKMKLGTQSAHREQEDIVKERNDLKKAYEEAMEEAQKKLVSLKEAHDPSMNKSLEEKLTETTMEVQALQEEMKRVHAFDLDDMRALKGELNGAKMTLQRVHNEEIRLRECLSDLKMEIDEVKKEQETEIEHNARIDELLYEIENTMSDAKEMGKKRVVLKQEAEAAVMAEKEAEQQLRVALEEVEEARAAEKRAVDALKEKTDATNKVGISRDEFERLKAKVNGNMIMAEAEMKISAATAEVEAINGRSEIVELEEMMKEMEEIKVAMEEAEKKADMAEEARRVPQAELNRRKSQKEQMHAR